MARATEPRRTFVVVLKNDDEHSADIEPYLRYEQLFRDTENARRELTEELEKMGLADQAELEPATGFSMLLVEATEEAVDCLRQSPRVAEVAAAPAHLRVDLV